MKMKTSLLMGAFSLALFIGGCTATPAAAPVAGPAGPQGATGATGQTGDPGRDADRRREDDQKRAEDDKRTEDRKQAEHQRISDARARDSHDTGCPSGEHVYTNAEGRMSCVKD
jgi:hypothetical protein